MNLFSALIVYFRRIKNAYVLRYNLSSFDRFSLGPNASINTSFSDPSFRLTIGSGSFINCAIHFERDGAEVVIGNGVYIGAGTKLIASELIKIEDNVTISWGVTIVDHDSHSKNTHRRVDDHVQGLRNYHEHLPWADRKDWSDVESKPIHIRRGAWVGFDVTILKGVTVGDNAIVGACAVVAKDIKGNTVAVGNPAREVMR